jgi:3,4-dihydroxy 2-butanone 4-phosphate synthase/GTP cyclohydrolase II
MARLPDLEKVAKQWNLKLISVQDLIKYRLAQESLIQREITVKMPTTHGDFDLYAYTQRSNGAQHLALVKGDLSGPEPVLVRVHSSCITGDIFGSCRCDCGPQLHQAMEQIDREGRGAIIYMNQEGRGIGLLNKLKAYKLQEAGRDTVQANEDLGFRGDERDYGVGAAILRDLGLRQLRLLTNNPKKRTGLSAYGIEIVDTVPIEIAPNQHNQTYLTTKRDKMGHDILQAMKPDTAA